MLNVPCAGSMPGDPGTGDLFWNGEEDDMLGRALRYTPQESFLLYIIRLYSNDEQHLTNLHPGDVKAGALVGTSRALSISSLV